MIDVLFILLFFISFFMMRSVGTLFHELGHAIPAILFTRENVTIYVGTYGDPTGSFRCRIGLLTIWFRYNPFSWRSGICFVEGKNVSINQQIIYTLSGSLLSLSIAWAACYAAFVYDLHGAVKFLLVLFVGMTTLDFFRNLIPSSRPTLLHDGTEVYNDGNLLRRLLSQKRLTPKYNSAVDFYENKNFLAAGKVFDELIQTGMANESVYRMAIFSLIEIKRWDQAKNTSDKFLSAHKMSDVDLGTAGLIYSQLGLHEEALELYDKSLAINPNNWAVLNNKGFTCNVTKRFSDAILLFDRAIEIDPSAAYPYNNRGLAKIKTGELDDGLEDIRTSFRLDENNSYAFMNLGIYHADKKEYAEALRLFQKAKELDASTYLIDELIAEVMTNL